MFGGKVLFGEVATRAIGKCRCDCYIDGHDTCDCGYCRYCNRQFRVYLAGKVATFIVDGLLDLDDELARLTGLRWHTARELRAVHKVRRAIDGVSDSVWHWLQDNQQGQEQSTCVHCGVTAGHDDGCVGYRMLAGRCVECGAGLAAGQECQACQHRAMQYAI